MSKQISFSKIENTILPDFRNKINHAESTEDLKKFFIYSVQEIFNHVFSGEISFDFNDISLQPDSEPYYRLDQHLLASNDFREIWDKSDLPKVIGRLARTAAKHHTRLGKNPGKTEAKIRK